jgi:pimeloyl-ACP methyl ester carboxylesterase
VLGEIAMAIANRPLFVRELKRGSPHMDKAYASHAYDDFTKETKRHVLRWYRAMDPEVHDGWDTALLAATKATPKQVLWGDRDPFLPSHTADRYEAATVHHFPDYGHHVMIEDPDASAAAIAALVSAE